MTIMNRKIAKEKRVKSAKFVVRKNLRVVRRKSVGKMSLKRSQKKKKEMPILTSTRRVSAVGKREKKKKRNLKLSLQLHHLLLLNQVSQTCQQLKRFAALSI